MVHCILTDIKHATLGYQLQFKTHKRIQNDDFNCMLKNIYLQRKKHQICVMDFASHRGITFILITFVEIDHEISLVNLSPSAEKFKKGSWIIYVISVLFLFSSGSVY